MREITEELLQGKAYDQNMLSAIMEKLLTLCARMCACGVCVFVMYMQVPMGI